MCDSEHPSVARVVDSALGLPPIGFVVVHDMDKHVVEGLLAEEEEAARSPQTGPETEHGLGVLARQLQHDELLPSFAPQVLHAVGDTQPPRLSRQNELKAEMV